MEQKLPKEFKEKWLSALRSGEYTQAREALWVGNGYCCLGVACKVAGYKDKEIEGYGSIYGDIQEGIPDILIGEIESSSIIQTLIRMNDGKYDPRTQEYEGYKSFKEIADWIEENL